MVLPLLGASSLTSSQLSWADTERFPRVEEPPASGYFLDLRPRRWRIGNLEKGARFFIELDFEKEQQRLNRQKLGAGKDLLARAVGLKNQKDPVIFDGSLGLGKDALHLIHFGAQILGCEADPFLFAWVRNELANCSLPIPLALHHGPCESFLPQYCDDVDCLYFDPMFENFDKKSAPKKSMAFLREWIIQSHDMQRVIPRCLDLGAKRVVVKRPRNGEHLYMRPDIEYSGNLIRYDVYLG